MKVVTGISTQPSSIDHSKMAVGTGFRDIGVCLKSTNETEASLFQASIAPCLLPLEYIFMWLN